MSSGLCRLWPGGNRPSLGSGSKDQSFPGRGYLSKLPGLGQLRQVNLSFLSNEPSVFPFSSAGNKRCPRASSQEQLGLGLLLSQIWRRVGGFGESGATKSLRCSET